MKKGSGKGKAKAVKAAKKRSSKPKKPIDLAEVRKDIVNIVGGEAAGLTQAVMEEGRKGQLAPVKYLFEMVGLYPALEQIQGKPEEESLAKTLLHRLGLPEDPVMRQENEAQEDETPMKLNPAGSRTAGDGAAEDGCEPAGPQSGLEDQVNSENTEEDDGTRLPAQSIP